MNIEQVRAEFETWWRKRYNFDDLDAFEIELAFEAYQAGRASLQSQEMVVIIEALEAAQNYIGSRRPFGSSDPDSDSYDHDAFMWDYYQKAIDHAKRIEGDEK